MNPQPPQNCSRCEGPLALGSRFCQQCGLSVSAVPDTDRKKSIIIAVAICLGIVVLFFLLNKPSNRVSLSSATTTSERNSTSIVSSIAQATNQLTNAKVERAVGQLTSNLRVAGAISVEGIQELPQENSAKADLRFNNFQYKSDMAGTPLSSSRQAPEKPQINDPNFYDKMYRYGTQQVHTKTYSGPGFAVLKHYNDGRWVLKEVRWQFNGWVGDVDIR